MALAMLGAQIKNYSADEMFVAMLGIIGRTHLNMGYPFDKAKSQTTIDELCIDLQKLNGTLTILEIELAFKMGWKKELSIFSKDERAEQFRKYGKADGDFYGLNNATYFGWVNAYAWGEKRLSVKKRLLDAKENANKEPDKKSEEEIEYILKAAVLKSFDEYRKNVLIFDAGNVKYNYLVKKGLINFTKERKDEILSKTRDKLRQQAIENKSRTETIEKTLSKILEETVKSEAKKEALNEYFKELAEMEIELSDLLE